jgi:hypothetical protein
VDRARVSELSQQVREFTKKNDWISARDAMAKILEEIGTPTPIYMLRMASLETRAGNNRAALEWMSRYAATGLTYDISTDDDLKPLLAEKDYAAIAARMKDGSSPISNAEVVCTLPMSDLMPEDLTYEKSSRTFIVSSVRHHTLYRVTLPKNQGEECGLQEIPLEESAKRWPILAVSFDSTRKVLWMTASAMPGFSGFRKEDSGKTSLIALNPTSGKILRRFDLDARGEAVLGDMSISSDGTLFVTDSIGGGVYRLQGQLEAAKLEKIAGGLFSPQTPILANDGKRLFVADYSIGIAVIDPASGKVTYLSHPMEIAVGTLDGLTLSGDTLIGIQNGTDPERIMRYRLNPDQTAVVSQEVIEQGPHLGDPTHVIVVDGYAYVLANVGWGEINDNGELKADHKFTAPILMRFPLK